MMRVTPEQQAIAEVLNLNPKRPSTWPMDIINKLIPTLNRHGIEGVKHDVKQLLE